MNNIMNLYKLFKFKKKFKINNYIKNYYNFLSENIVFFASCIISDVESRQQCQDNTNFNA